MRPSRKRLKISPSYHVAFSSHSSSCNCMLFFAAKFLLALFLLLAFLSLSWGWGWDFPASFCTTSRKFAASVVMICCANMWMTRILGLINFDITCELLCVRMHMASFCEGVLELTCGAIISFMDGCSVLNGIRLILCSCRRVLDRSLNRKHIILYCVSGGSEKIVIVPKKKKIRNLINIYKQLSFGC